MFSGRKKSPIEIIISCQADSPACVIRFEHNAVLWLEHCFQLKSGCDLPGQGPYPDWQVYKRRQHVWWAEKLGKSTWGVRGWDTDWDAPTHTCTSLLWVERVLGASHGVGGIPQWWAPVYLVQHGLKARLIGLDRFYCRAHGQSRGEVGKVTPSSILFQGYSLIPYQKYDGIFVWKDWRCRAPVPGKIIFLLEQSRCFFTCFVQSYCQNPGVPGQ